jgi:uncharacterized protein involved in outer membrane biogenesis
VKGAIDIDAAAGRPRSIAKFHSQNLRLADFGLRAAGRETQPSSLLMSSAALNPDAMRRTDAAVSFEASKVEVGRQVLQNFSGKLQLERGIVSAAALSGEILGGKLSGKVKLDATQDSPLADVDLTSTDLQLALWPHKGEEPPMEGAARLHLKVTGRGISLHEVAASAEGSFKLMLPQGAMRTSLAELTGVDLRGLGLALEKNKSETAVRCAAVNFSAHEGVFTVQQMIIDTEPVRIEGEGAIRMDTEAVALVMRGEPKSLRVLRLKAPVAVRGTLSHPSFGIEKGDSKLVLMDRGHGKDEDCSALVK